MFCLLDTSICVELIRGRSPAPLAALRQRKVGTVGISSITLAELQFGVVRSSDPEHNRMVLTEFMAPLLIAPFDDRAAASYGKLRAELEGQGQPIGPLDTLIAAHALSLGWTLVTNNEREFRRAPGLLVENWLKV